jgi:hypothetical protein
VTATSISLPAIIGVFLFGSFCLLLLLVKGLRTGRTMHWNSYTVDREMQPVDFWTCMALYALGGLFLLSGATLLSIPLWR